MHRLSGESGCVSKAATSHRHFRRAHAGGIDPKSPGELMFEQQYFGDFVVQQLPYLKRLVCKLTRGDQIADDIVQQTMLKALIHAHQFRFQPSLKTWLSSIAVNEVHQVYRSKWQKSAVPMQTEMVDTQRAQSPYRQDRIGGNRFGCQDSAPSSTEEAATTGRTAKITIYDGSV